MTDSYDVIVIGGGPAGMMAAGRAAALGAKVLLLEKNATLGKKLLITGGGRCNVTNAEFDQRTLLAKFKGNDKFLFSPFSQFGVQHALDFFHTAGMETKVEAERRVFPVSDRAQSVWDVLVRQLADTGVTVRSHAPVAGFEVSDKKITGVRLASGQVITAASYILATGGKSRPETGSTGEGFTWLSAIGHTVSESDAALVPVKTQEPWNKRLAGLSIPHAKLTTFQNDKKQDTRMGKLLFTHVGLSGPVVLNMSRDIGELLTYGAVSVSVDMMPDLDKGALDKKCQDVFKLEQNKKIKNGLGKLVAPILAPVLIELAKIRPETFINNISRQERLALVDLIKDLRLTVTGLVGEKAVVTSGGVKLEEVDTKTMQSRLYPNLYLVGDILNIDRPSGGYSLQLCWTTGWVAGTASSAIGGASSKRG